MNASGKKNLGRCVMSKDDRLLYVSVALVVVGACMIILSRFIEVAVQ